MKARVTTTRHGFTLLELLAAVVIMGVVSAVVLPVITASSDSYATAREIRSRTEQVSLAMDRMTRIIRQAPIGAGDLGVGISTATETALVFSDGTGFEFNGDAIEMLVPGTSNARLCSGVDAISIQYLRSDGVTSSIAEPGFTHRIVITVTSGDLRMSVVAHPRVWIGQEAAS